MGNFALDLSTIVLVLSISSSVSIVYKKEHSFAPPFEGQTDIFRNWYFSGTAALHEGLVRLTAEEPMNQGAIWCSHASFMKDWEIQVHFRIFGQEPIKYGDGIGIWYTKEALHLGPVFGNKDKFTGLGVFIDTHENITHPHQHRHPYVSAVINNGSLSYKHDEYGTFQQLGGCHINVRNKPPSVPTAIAISYMQNALTVFTDTEGLMQWVPCFRVENVHLPAGYFFGVSASTSWLTDFHDIMTVSTLDMSQYDPQGHGDSSSQYSDEESKSDVFQEPEAIEEEEDLVLPSEIERVLEKVQRQEVPEEQQPVVQQQEEKHVHKEPFVQEQKFPPPPKEEPRQEKRKKEEERKKTIPKDKPEQTKTVLEEPKKMSWLKMIMYTTAIVIVFVICIRWFASYNARRKEKIRKRLY